MVICTDDGSELAGIFLCAGYGGLDLGITIAEPRYRTVCYVEREAHAAATLVARMADEAWIKRLYGTISNPSMAQLGAAEFISSLPVTHASRSAWQENDAAEPIRVTYGPTSRGSSVKPGQRSSSSKMSKATSIWDLPKSRASFAEWAIMQKRACSQREKQAQATGVAASSSWPTPTATDAGYMPDLMLSGGSVQPKSPFDIGPTSCGQFSLSNAARSWTQLWRIINAMGWQSAMMLPVNMNSRFSHQVRVSFKFGKGSSLGDLISNPQFFEMIMGWPIGWTAPEQPVTGFAHWKQRSRIALSVLLSSANGGQQHD